MKADSAIRKRNTVDDSMQDNGTKFVKCNIKNDDHLSLSTQSSVCG